MDLTQKRYDEQYSIVASIISKGYLAHGGEKMFNTFDPAFIQGGSRAEYGYGFYFCDQAYKPINYGGYLYFTKKDVYDFCNLNTPTDYNPLEWIYKISTHLENACAHAKNIEEYENATKQLENMKLNSQEQTYLDFFEKGVREERDLKNAYKYALNYIPGDYNPKYLSSLFMKVGYDGIIAENQYVIFNFDKLNQNILKLDLNDYDNFMKESIEINKKLFYEAYKKLNRASN